MTTGRNKDEVAKEVARPLVDSMQGWYIAPRGTAHPSQRGVIKEIGTAIRHNLPMGALSLRAQVVCGCTLLAALSGAPVAVALIIITRGHQ